MMEDFKKPFDVSAEALFDRGDASPKSDPWPPVIIAREQIDEEIERLAAGPMPPGGRRESLIVHPRAWPGSPGLAPGIQVKLCVLKPGETTPVFRHNATDVTFCIRGTGRALVGARNIGFSQYDTWNSPSYMTQSRENSGDDLQVCLNYSNASLLQFMQVYIREEAPDIEAERAPEPTEPQDENRVSPFGVFEIGEDGATLMPYEVLINPPAVESRSLHWPWSRVRTELQKLEGLGKSYVGRRLYLLYNPVTGRTNGTTPNFFATITIRPPGIVDRPHRHVSAAINYYFHGSGRSSVAGNVYHWKAGDLMLSAPGWTVHNHASDDEVVYELTIQDQPLNIAMESLLWQENMHAPPALLGVQAGFTTNR